MMEIYKRHLKYSLPSLQLCLELTLIGAGFWNMIFAMTVTRVDWVLSILSVFKSCVTVIWRILDFSLWEHPTPEIVVRKLIMPQLSVSYRNYG